MSVRIGMVRGLWRFVHWKPTDAHRTMLAKRLSYDHEVLLDLGVQIKFEGDLYDAYFVDGSVLWIHRLW